MKYLNISIFVLLLFLFGWATVKLKHNASIKTIDGSLKYQYPECSGHLKVPFSYAITGYGLKQFLSGSNREAIKSWADIHHQNCLSSNGITPKNYLDLLLKVMLIISHFVKPVS